MLTKIRIQNSFVRSVYLKDITVLLFLFVFFISVTYPSLNLWFRLDCKLNAIYSRLCKVKAFLSLSKTERAASIQRLEKFSKLEASEILLEVQQLAQKGGVRLDSIKPTKTIEAKKPPMHEKILLELGVYAPEAATLDFMKELENLGLLIKGLHIKTDNKNDGMVHTQIKMEKVNFT